MAQEIDEVCGADALHLELLRQVFWDDVLASDLTDF